MHLHINMNVFAIIQMAQNKSKGKKKYRVGCLHGFSTNATFFKKIMGSFTKALSDQMEFQFLDGPYIISDALMVDETVVGKLQGEPRSWIDLSYSFKINNQQYQGAILSGLEKVFKGKSFDALLGFSQGTIVINFLLSLHRMGKINWKWLDDVKFTIMICGGFMSSPNIKQKINQPFNLPSVHLTSEMDVFYSNTMISSIHYLFPLVLQHSYGHAAPKLGPLEAKKIMNYLKKRIKQKDQENQLGMSIFNSRL